MAATLPERRRPISWKTTGSQAFELEPGVDAVQFLFGERLPVFSKRLFLGSAQ
jgi:hypothetical protein